MKNVYLILFCIQFIAIDFSYTQNIHFSLDALSAFTGKYGGLLEYRFQERQTLGISFDMKFADKKFTESGDDLAELILFPWSILVSTNHSYEIDAKQRHLGVSWRYFMKTPKNGAYFKLVGGLGWYNVYFEHTINSKTLGNNPLFSETKTQTELFNDRFSTLFLAPVFGIQKTYKNGFSIDAALGVRFEGLSTDGDVYDFAQNEKQFRKIYNSKLLLDFSIGKWF